jgi:hypothetical protein
MSAALPPEIVVTETDDGVRYRLPRPQIGPGRFAGCFLIPFGCLGAGMGGAFVVLALRVIVDLTMPVALIACLVLLIPLAILLGGLALIFFGGWMLAGHQEITLTSRHIRSAWCLGPVRWPGRRSRALLKQFTVVRGDQAIANHLQADCEGSKPLRLALGFPEEWLQPLADDLARKCRALPAEEGDRAAVSVVEESTSPQDIRNRPERPVNCRAFLEEQAAGVTVVMPPPGIWQGNNKFIVFWAFGWCVMLLPITVGFGAAAMQGNMRNKHGQPVSPLWSILYLVPFWLVGISALLVVLYRGRRGATLAVEGDRLVVVQSSLFGMRRREWLCKEIAELRVACDRRSKVVEGEGNPDFPWLIDLRIVARDGEGVNVITYREGDPHKADLEWMATVLRGALRLSGE